MIRDIELDEKEDYNKVISHPLQSFEWGEFRKKTGIKVIRKGIFQDNKLIDGFSITIHPIPYTPFTIGYVPKCNYPEEEMLEELNRIGKIEKCIFIQLEPNVIEKIFDSKSNELVKENKNKNITSHPNIVDSAHPLFTKFTFMLDLTKTEEELRNNMHSKTRYNIKVAKKHGVKITESDNFDVYWRLMKETTSRQKFYAHTKRYHRLMWDTLHSNSNDLKAHLLIASHENIENKTTYDLVAWILFEFKDTLYYPYGASSTQFRNLMASNLMMWEVIEFGKKHGLKKFDMWGSLGTNPDTKDSWYGFHRLKLGYSPELIEFIGSYDLIMNNSLYNLYKISNRLRWLLLKIK
jgi:lipid II:glycine glycyltransferase (peptidoglycan interpeptide bridge formation enzyme)